MCASSRSRLPLNSTFPERVFGVVGRAWAAALLLPALLVGIRADGSEALTGQVTETFSTVFSGLSPNITLSTGALVLLNSWQQEILVDGVVAQTFPAITQEQVIPFFADVGALHPPPPVKRLLQA